MEWPKEKNEEARRQHVLYGVCCAHSFRSLSSHHGQAFFAAISKGRYIAPGPHAARAILAELASKA